MKGSAMLRGLPAGEERRDLNLADAGINIQTEDKRFTGHAAVFNTRAAIGNPKTFGFWEQVAPGAFSRTIKGGDARMLIDHDSSKVVSRVSAGTLLLGQDERGLAVDSALDLRLSYVSDLVVNLENRNITGMSFGFQVLDDEWTVEEQRDADGEPYEVQLRNIREVKLFETSAVTFPAYAETDAGLRYSLVPALRSRNDRDAIARAVSFKPELGPLLGYDPELAPWTISLDGNGIASIVDAKINESMESLSFALNGRAMSKSKSSSSDDSNSSKEPYGDVEYADPGYQKDGKKRYPIDTEEHAKAAWSYINQAGNAANYSADQLASIKAKIKAALKKFGVQVSDDEHKSLDGPAETTHQDDTAITATDTGSAASTRNAPSPNELAKARLRMLKLQLRH